MAIVDPISDVYTSLLPTSAKTVVFPSTTRSDFEPELHELLTNVPARHATEPLGGMDSILDDDVLLDDADEVDEANDTGPLEELPGRSQSTRAPTACHERALADRFRSTRHDIAGPGVLQH